MPPVDNYQRVDLQNSDETSRQFNKKSIDQTHNEARIENGSVRDTIEDTSIAFSSPTTGQSSDALLAAASVDDNSNSASGAVDSDLVLNSRILAEQSEGFNASVNVRKGGVDHYNDTTAQPVDQFNDVESNFPGDDHESVVGNNDVTQFSQTHSGVAVSTNNPVSGVNNDALAEQSITREDDAQIDSVDNITVEQAFDFLTEQTEDNYVS